MRALAVAAGLLSGCALQTWAVPDTSFRTWEAVGLMDRLAEASKAHCDGVKVINVEAGVVVSPWKAWNTGQGLVLTQCYLSVLRGDAKEREIRVSFSARECPLSSMDDLEALAATCPRAEVVPELVSNGLQRITEGVKKDVTR